MAVTVAIGLLLQAIEVNTYYQKTDRTQRVLKAAAQTNSILLMASNEILCENEASQIIGQEYFMNCIRGDAEPTDITDLMLNFAAPEGFGFEIKSDLPDSKLNNVTKGTLGLKDYYQINKVMAKAGDVIAGRDPAAIMLAMDKSGSMSKYDIPAQEAAAANAIVSDGTCNNTSCTATTTNCGLVNTRLGWKKIAEFVPEDYGITITPANSYNGYRFIRVRLDYAGYAGSCAPEFRMQEYDEFGSKVGNLVYSKNINLAYNANNINISLRQERLNHRFDIEAWSDEEIDYTVWIGEEHYAASNFEPFNDGTKEGTGSNCTNFDGWVTLYTIVIPNGGTAMKVLSEMYATGYDGQCNNFRVKIVAPNGNQYNTLGCLTSTYCYTSTGAWTNRNGPYLPAGTWTVMGWSDDLIGHQASGGTSKYINLNWHSYLFGLAPFFEGPLGGGTCASGPCQVISGNCTNTNKTNWTEISSFEVTEHMRGINAKVSYLNFIDTTNCSAGMKLVSPNGTGYCTSTAPECVTYNASKNSTMSITTSAAAPIDYGTWKLYGWSNNPASNPTLFETSKEHWIKQRIDASKSSAKLFIDNISAPGSGWQPDKDKIGLVPYSDNAGTVISLTNDTTAVKTAFDGFVPSGQTNLALAIQTSVTELAINAAESHKFIILLTDGQANMCLSGVSCPEKTATEQAIAEAETARLKKTVIYVIGFGSEISGNIYNTTWDYEDALRQIAGDGSYCNDDYCGRYFFAENEDALDAIYEFIKKDIGDKVKYGPTGIGETVSIKVWEE